MMMIQFVQARWCHYLQSSWYEKDAYLFKNMSFQKARCGWEKRRDTRIYNFNLLNLGVNLPTENREHILMNSEGLNIYL